MKRVLALCTFGLAIGGCDLGFGQNDQSNDGDADLPGEEYQQCVLGTLEQCDTDDLTPDACTALIAEQCNGGDSDCDPNSMDPTGGGCDPGDCFQVTFDGCIEAGLDPDYCKDRAEGGCTPQCMPGDPNCEPWPCDPASGQPCECQPGDPMCEPPPPDDCWTQVYEECLAIDPSVTPEDCALRADMGCYPQPCDPASGEWCCQPGDPNCEPPPPCDPTNDPMCEPPPPPKCDPSSGQTCPCDDQTDPNCWPPDPCAGNSMDPNCWPTDPPPDDPPPGCQTGDPNCMP